MIYEIIINFLKILFDFFSNYSRYFGRFANPRAYDQHLLPEAYDVSMTNFYNVNTITDWGQLVRYIRLYLERVISSTPFYLGPYSRETTYILPELLSINDFNVISIDSQPAFFIQERQNIGESYIQLPYIQLLASYTVVQNIMNAAVEYRRNNPVSRFLAIVSVNGQVSTDYTDITRELFPGLNLQERVWSIFFGVIRPTPDDIEVFLDYIFTNAFFRDIINIINIASR